jgi:hypothetical protein
LEGEATSSEVVLEYAYALRQQFSSVWINSLYTEEFVDIGEVTIFNIVVTELIGDYDGY